MLVLVQAARGKGAQALADNALARHPRSASLRAAELAQCFSYEELVLRVGVGPGSTFLKKSAQEAAARARRKTPVGEIYSA